MIDSRKRRLTVACLAAFAALGTFVPALAAEATPTPSGATNTITVQPTQWSRSTFSMDGAWRLTEHFLDYKGVPVRAGQVADGVEVDTFTPTQPALTSVFDDPVYFGQRDRYAGEWFASPFVSPLGVVLDMTFAGTSEDQPTGYTEIVALRATNSTATPLMFSGTFIDSRGSSGTATMTPEPTP